MRSAERQELQELDWTVVRLAVRLKMTIVAKGIEPEASFLRLLHAVLRKVF